MIEDNFPKVVQLTRGPEDITYAAGETHWFDGECNFKTTIQQLQAEGKLGSAPYELPLPYLSVSQVEMYLKCPMSFYHRYIKGEKKPPGIALVQGTTVHKALEEGYKHVIVNHALPGLDFVLDTYSGELDKNLKDEVVWDAKDEDGEETAASDPGKLKDQGVHLLKLWHKNKLPNTKPRAVEKSFVTSLGGIPVVGRIDMIDRVTAALDPASMDDVDMHPLLDAVVDHKVVGKTYARQLVDNKIQMSLYAHATGVPTARYDLYVKSKVPKITEMLTNRDAREVRWAVHTFVEVAKAISKGVFPMCAPDMFMCNPKWCGYYSICRGAV
jgi:hypothetical protein